MKIVEFNNGTFGVRTYWFFGWHYLMLMNTPYGKLSTRPNGTGWGSCQSTSKERCERFIARYSIGEV